MVKPYALQEFMRVIFSDALFISYYDVGGVSRPFTT